MRNKLKLTSDVAAQLMIHNVVQPPCKAISLECNTTKPPLRSFRKPAVKMSFVFYCLIFILLASLMPDAQGKDFVFFLFEKILAFLSLFLPMCSIFLILTFFYVIIRSTILFITRAVNVTFWLNYFDVVLANDIESVNHNFSSTSQYAEETKQRKPVYIVFTTVLRNNQFLRENYKLLDPSLFFLICQRQLRMFNSLIQQC